jgi:hypothetical protein
MLNKRFPRLVSSWLRNLIVKNAVRLFVWHRLKSYFSNVLRYVCENLKCISLHVFLFLAEFMVVTSMCIKQSTNGMPPPSTLNSERACQALLIEAI